VPIRSPDKPDVCEAGDRLPKHGNLLSRGVRQGRFRLTVAALVFVLGGAETYAATDLSTVKFEWMVKIPMRDGVDLAATVYRPADEAMRSACLFTLTPYTRQTYHTAGEYFAARGYPFLSVDVRGRGDSGGIFAPMLQEAKDGFDVVEWLAKQPYCNGKVGMWGGSYSGYDQWATAKERPPHLATIVPVASPYPGVDFPSVQNIFGPYDVQWLTATSGHAFQGAIFGDSDFWARASLSWFESGRPFRDFDAIVGNPLPVFQEWISHPEQGPYWDAYNPTTAEYASLTIPILAITGMYDNQQSGTLTFYRDYMKAAAPEGRARYFLVMGPWDHAGTRKSTDNVGGIKFGPHALLDIPRLHADWYAWTMKEGPKPEFLKNHVAYYVSAADQWRYADTLEAITAQMRPFYLESTGGAANDVLSSGLLAAAKPSGAPDRYVYDPRDTSNAALEAGLDSSSMLDRTMVYAMRGKELIYHSAPFLNDTEIAGFFRLSAWIAIDQTDTDFDVSINEILIDGTAIPLSSQLLRARYRESLRSAKLVTTQQPQRYDFNSFAFASRVIRKGSRLELIVGPAESISLERNYNSGGVVSEESIKNARPVTVTLFHDAAHPSVLYVPIGAAS
jgi:putative CocE/NonD family hydrolase